MPRLVLSNIPQTRSFVKKMFKTLFRSTSATSLYCKRYYCCAPIIVNDPCTQLSVLPNGVRVATEESGSPLTCITLFVEAGPRFEVPCNNGISHLIEHLAFKGFNSTCREDLEAFMVAMGTKISSKTNREIQYFSARSLPEYTPHVIDILSKVITDIEVTDEKIEELKYNICLEMVDADNDPKAVVFDYLHQTAFQGTNLAQSVIGPSGNLQLFDQDFCRAFLRDHYQPYKLCLTASGAVEHEKILHFANDSLGHMVSEPVCVSVEGPKRYTGSQVIYRDDSMPFIHVAIAVEAAGYGSPDYLPLMTLRNIVGSWDRSQGGEMKNKSPLARAVSTSYLCERYEAFYLPYKDIGLWGVYFICDKNSAEDMVYNIQNEWMKLSTSLNKNELDRGRNITKHMLLKSRTGGFNTCQDMGMEVMYTCNRRSLEELLTEVNCCKDSIIQNICNKYIYDRCPVVAAVGPTEALPDYTRIRSGMYWLRL